MSQWYCRILDQELGPLTFSELAELARSETLSESDRVRDADDAEWRPASTVVGFFHTARRADAASSPAPDVVEEPEDDVRQEVAALDPWASASPLEPVPGETSETAWSLVARRWVVSAIAMGLLVCASAWWENSRAEARFPRPARIQKLEPQRHRLFGTGPWTTLEFGLLVADTTLVATAGVALSWTWIANRVD